MKEYRFGLELQTDCKRNISNTMQDFSNCCYQTWSINPFPNKPWFFTCLQYKLFKNTVGKGELSAILI